MRVVDLFVPTKSCESGHSPQIDNIKTRLKIKILYTVSPVRWDTYFQANRVEHQKLNQTTAELSFG